jgi:hypothetical protein
VKPGGSIAAFITATAKLNKKWVDEGIPPFTQRFNYITKLAIVDVVSARLSAI